MPRDRWTIEQSAIGRIAVPPTLPPNLACFTSTVDFHGRLDGERAGALLGVLRDRFGIDAGLTTGMQVHGTALTRAGSLDAGSWREDSPCDALVTGARGVALGVKIADCLPVTLFDGVARIVAGIHSGWRGATGKIVPATIERLVSEGSFDPARAVAYLGPSIRLCCFEVGEEVVDALHAAFGDVDGFIDRGRGARPHVDLPGLTRQLLIRAGFAEAAIDDSEICTRCEGSIFHSYRRDGAAAGRNLSIAAMR